jgi:hypothetical protein
MVDNEVNNNNKALMMAQIAVANLNLHSDVDQ